MIQRHITGKLLDAASKNPVVTLTGPRQSGKTTLLKSVFPQHRYVSLENPDERLYATEDPRGFLKQFSQGVILDEVQQCPDLLSYIQSIVDDDNSVGRFILSGSQNFLLHGKVSQSLAGRTSILHLMPFTKREIENRQPLTFATMELDAPMKASVNQDLFNTMFTGFYPRIHDKQLDPKEWLYDYFQTYIQRDVRMILNIGDTDAFIRFVRLCAGRVAQLFNSSSLAADCGVSPPTVHRWGSVLESCFITFKLLPHYRNFSKRLVKSPKVYFFDTGLLCYLLRVRNADELRQSPFRGQIFENFCIAEFMKTALHDRRDPDCYFWRDSTGHEVDLMFESPTSLTPVEIKSGETFNPSFIDNVIFWNKLTESKHEDAAVIYGGDARLQFKGVRVLPWWML